MIRVVTIALTVSLAACVSPSPPLSVATECHHLRDNPEGYASCARLINMQMAFRAERRQQILDEPLSLSTYQFDPSLYSPHTVSMPPAPPTGVFTELPHQPIPVGPPLPRFIPYGDVASSMPGINSAGYVK